jgi:hypothetical protein
MALSHSPQIIRDGLVLYLDAANIKSYPGSGTTWFDLAGSNNGTLINGPTFNSSNKGYFSFDASNDYINTTFSQNIVTTGFTYSFWFYATQSSVDFPAQFFVNSDANTVFRIERFSAGSNTIEFGHSPNSAPVGNHELISYNFPNNFWYYCTLVYDGNYKYIYKNDTLDIQSPPNQSLTYYSGAFLRIAARQDSSLFPFGGNISLVKIYQRPLSLNEIKQNFNATRGRYGI